MKKGLMRTILSKQNRRRYICVFLVILMIITILPLNLVVYAASDEFDSLREKYKMQITGYDPANPYDPNDTYIKEKIQLIDSTTNKWWSSMNKTTYTWDDVKDSSATNSANMGSIVSRLKSMAVGWATPGSDYYNRPDLLSDIKKGLDWFYSNRYNENITQYDNWWNWQIGAPTNLNDTVVLLYDQLTSTQITKYMDAVNHFSPTVYECYEPGHTSTGANRLSMCKVVGIRAIIVKDTVKLQESSEGMNDVFLYSTSGDGFYTDGSYIQHTYSPYAGSYGRSLLTDISDLLWLLAGSTWDNTSPDRGNVYEWVFNSFEPVMYKGGLFDSVRGRDISRYNNSKGTIGYYIVDSLLRLSDIPSNPHAGTFKSIIKYHLQNGFQDCYFRTFDIWSIIKARSILDDTTLTPRAELTGNFQFYNQDRVVHRRAGWVFDLAMHSERIRNYECMSGENLKSWYTADGMTYIYLDPSDYSFNYWPTVDPHRMPGTTVDRDTSRPDSTGGGPNMLGKSWIGGVSLESYGTAGMDFKQHNSPLTPPADVEAKKSWFMFDDEVVALGAGITSTSGRTIETVFENRAINSQGNNTLTVNGIAKPSSLGWSETMNDVNWIHLDGTGGYVFPDSTQVKGLRERREGEWYDINNLMYEKADDDFNRLAQGSGWEWVREDSAKHILSGTALDITTQFGTIEGATNTTKNILLAPAPAFNFYTDTKLTFSTTTLGQKAGLILYKDDDNYVYISRVYTGSGQRINTVSESNGTPARNTFSDTYGATVYFKIEKCGSDYLLYASSDGQTWGTALHTYTNAMAGTDGTNSCLKMGLFAQNGLNPSAPEITASFDYHHVTVVRNYMTLWTDHGVDPENATYSYIILPGKTAAEVESYNGNQNVSILKNDTTVQAVKEDTLGIIGANFWGIGNVSYITSYNPAAVMVKDQNNQLEIAVSDPTHEQQQVIVEFGKYGLSVVSKDPAVTVLQQSPTIKLKVDVSQEPGKTYNATIAYDPLASTSPPEIITTELQPDADSYVRDGKYADTNYGSEINLAVRKSTTADDGYSRESYLKFDLGPVKGEFLSAKLYVYGKVSEGVTNINVYGVDDDTWAESKITWNNKPARGSCLSTVRMTTSRIWHEIDVTSYVQSQYAGDKKASLAIIQDAATYKVSDFNSKENTENKPYLKVVAIAPAEITTELQPETDSYVRDGKYADINYGSEINLAVRKSTTADDGYSRESYLKFDLSPVNGEFLSAILYVYGKVSEGVTSINVYGVDDDTWTESKITWNSKPARGRYLSTVHMTTSRIWHEIDVTSYVQSQYVGDKKVSIAIIQDAATYKVSDFNSKENTENKPYLKVVAIAPAEIEKFNPIPDVQAGTAGTAIYADTAAVIAALPSSVTAVSVNNKTVTIPVNAWFDTDGYNPNVAGSYTFTATLGAIPPGYANTGNHAATVEVVVGTVPAPVLQSAVAGDGHVNITWSEVAGSTEYMVYASTVSNSYTEPVATVAGTVYGYDITGLTNGTTYYFAVKAVNPGGESAYSNEMSATPQVAVPGAPVLQSAVAGDGHVNITWSEVTGSTGYEVYASTVSNSYSVPVTTVAGLVYDYDVTGLTNGTTYYFTVKAVNPGGNSDYSNELSATPQVVAQGAPVIQSAVAGDGHVNITWSAVPGSTGYVVYASTVSNSYTEPVETVAGTVYGYDITGLTNGTTYYFAVKAVNPGGNSDYSNELSATPQVAAPGAPVIQSAVAGDGHVNITWSEVTGSTGYEVYASTVSNSYTEPVATVADTVYGYDITGLTNGTTYYFAVKAVNPGGSSDYSNELSAVPQVVAPGAPVIESAVAGDGHVNITWSAVNGSTGYEVYTSTVSNSYSVPVTTVAGFVYDYDVTGLTNGTTYYFAVKATNAGGDSPYSAEISATPKTIPGAPINVMAVAGNAQATVSFTAPLDNGGSLVTEYIVTSNPESITARGTDTSIIVTGLSNGTTYSFTVRAINAAGSSMDSAISNTVTPYTPSNEDDPEDDSNPPANMPEKEQLIPAETGIEMLVNGNTVTMATATTTVIEDKTVTTISIDDKRVEEILQNQSDNALLTLSAKNDSDVVVSRLNAQTVRRMEAAGAVLEIRTENVIYTLPAAQIGIDNVLSQFGGQVELKDITVNIKVSEPPENIIKIIEETANKNNYQIVVKPVEFEIYCTSGDKTVSVSKFNGYIERMVAIPEGVDPGKITTGVVLNPDGTFSHVPTVITVIDGKYYAKISSMTNSTYSVIWNLKSFKDVETHWAKDAVNDMGSRLIINGVSKEIFEPDRDISRAEFMAIVVKALGLMKPGAGKDVFGDVAKNAWYYDAVSAAYEYGIIAGYGNGKFDPDSKISREQVMVMIARAMEIVKQKVEFSDGEEDKLLENYIDAEKSADYAKNSIAACIKTGIVVGRASNLIAPKDFITRAEAVVIVRRLLQKSGLIN